MCSLHYQSKTNMKPIKFTRLFSFLVMMLLVLARIPVQAAEEPGDFFAAYPDQSEFPIIVLQPVDQLVPVGSEAAFSVSAANGPLRYQWLRNGVEISGATNSTFTIANAAVADVGRYSCNVSRELEIVPTRAAQLMVYAPKASANVNVNANTMQSGFSTLSAGTVVVYGMPVQSGGSTGSCPGAYAGYVNYTKSTAQGWGWAPSSGTTVHTATDPNGSNTKIQYYGMWTDSGCNQTSIAVPDPTFSPKYRFTIYFPDNVPTNSYSIELDGFDP